MHLDRVRRLAGAALAAGASRRSLTEIEWNVAGSCSDAVTVQLHGRQDRDKRHTLVRPQDEPAVRFAAAIALAFGMAKPTAMPLWLTMHVPCRKCESCRRRRRNLWAARAVAETRNSARTWFGTLTLTPDWQYRMLCQAIADRRARAVEFETLSPEQQFIARHETIAREITKYLKRVRQQSEAPLRFLLVAEKHKSGLPHYHILVHERDHMKPVRKAELTRQWTFGFTNWKLVDDASRAQYLCKYLGKDSSTRVRSSLRYGQADPVAALIALHPLGGRIAGAAKRTPAWEPPNPLQRGGNEHEHHTTLSKGQVGDNFVVTNLMETA